MDRATWQTISDEFVRAREASREERGALLARLHPVIRREVETLLAAEEATGDFLTPPAPAALLPGETVGAYRILHEIGSGGMGVVYLAERADGAFERKVAIKIVGDRLFGPDAARRFINERRILAQLDHPNIVRLIDGGITAGRRYFVMEFVEGLPVTRHAGPLPLRERLRLFVEVCAAVHYAHQHMIVHRDLKASNVLVNGSGVVKLLDFGVAQILDRNHGESAITHPLSLECVSPEQLRGEPVTAASDVYALGVLLYELLTGKNPQYDESTTDDEARRRVMEGELPSPRTVAPSIPEEVSAITRNALARDPKERYASASELQGDVQRFLDGLPVTVVPHSARYMAGKFVRRNRALTAMAAALLMTMCGAIWMFYHRSRIEARRFAHASGFARSVIVNVHPMLDSLPATLAVRKVLLESTVKYLEALSAEAEGSVLLLRELSSAYLQMSRLQGSVFSAYFGRPAAGRQFLSRSEEQMQKALVVAPEDRGLLRDAVILYSEMAEQDTFQLQEGAGHAATALRYARQYVKVASGDWDSRLLLAHATYHRGNALTRSALAEAMPLLASARDQFDQLHSENAAHLNAHRYLMLCMWRLAEGYQRKNDPDEALKYAQRGLQIAGELIIREEKSQRSRMYLSSANLLLSRIHRRRKNVPGALETAERGVALRQQILLQDKDNPQAQERVADALRTLAQALQDNGDGTQARKAASEAIVLYSSLRNQGSLPAMLLTGLAESHLVLASVAGSEKRHEERCSAARSAAEILAEVKEENLEARALASGCP